MFDHFFNAFFVWVFSVSEEDVPEKEPEADEDAEKPVHSDHDQLTHICNSILSTEIDQVVEDFWWSYPKSMDNSCGWWPPSRPCCPALRKDDAGGAAETDVWWEQRSGCTSWAFRSLAVRSADQTERFVIALSESIWKINKNQLWWSPF